MVASTAVDMRPPEVERRARDDWTITVPPHLGRQHADEGDGEQDSEREVDVGDTVDGCGPSAYGPPERDVAPRADDGHNQGGQPKR